MIRSGSHPRALGEEHNIGVGLGEDVPVAAADEGKQLRRCCRALHPDYRQRWAPTTALSVENAVLVELDADIFPAAADESGGALEGEREEVVEFRTSSWQVSM